jgi:N-acetylmuramoyl-L-alanine amidase
MRWDKVSRREVLSRAWRAAAGIGVLGGRKVAEGASLDIRNRYSPRNRGRPARPHTRYIVLHTTEGGEAGSLQKIWQRGEAHYFVTPRGVVYRIIDKSKIATHAGRSMWEGNGPMDHYSLGIEVVGHHNRDITEAQYGALRELLRQLRSLYRIPDERVVTHSMVAYGRPNRFHPYRHRGRKRCGMIFARADVRKRLGLTTAPRLDPDVEAGRLRVADLELHQYLFQPAVAATVAAAATAPVDAELEIENVITRGRTAWYIARDQYNSPETWYLLPDGSRLPGDQIADWARIPVGTRVIVGQPVEPSGFEGFTTVAESESARSIAGEAYGDRTTIYLFPSGMVRTGHDLNQSASTRRLLAALPAGTRVLVGYVYGGHVTRRRLPSRIAGRRWNYPSTFYRLPDGTILSGDEIDDGAIPPRTLVLFQS